MPMPIFFMAAFTTVGAAMLLGYVMWMAVYRLYFSPICEFPGPKLAALTFW